MAIRKKNYLLFVFSIILSIAITQTAHAQTSHSPGRLDNYLSQEAYTQSEPPEIKDSQDKTTEIDLDSPASISPTIEESTESTWWQTFWGKPARNHLYLGMWTYHFEAGEGQDWNNQLLALAYKGYYGGTFINTHCDRTWSLGVQRTWHQKQYGALDIELGYRMGMMYGYKKYLTLFDTRFFPLFQVVADIEYKNFGIEFSWAGVVATVGFLFRF